MAKTPETIGGEPVNEDTRGALAELGDDISHKASVTGIVYDKIGDLFDSVKEGNFWKMLQEAWGGFSMTMLGLLTDDEEFSEYKVERMKGLSYGEMKKGVGKMRVVKEKRFEDEEMPKNPTKPKYRAQWAANMKTMKAFNLETGKRYAKPKGRDIAKVLIEQNIKPSPFIMKGSYSLIDQGAMRDYSTFRQAMMDRLVDKSVRGEAERLRQASIIFSLCAVGEFQIMPYYHYDKMKWEKWGEEGMKNHYRYLCSMDRQFDLKEKTIAAFWRQEKKEPGYTMVAYYSGSASGYRKNPNDPKYHKPQYGGHKSIHDYYVDGTRLFKKIKKQMPYCTDLECVSMAIEKMEGGGHVIRDRILARRKRTDNRVA